MTIVIGCVCGGLSGWALAALLSLGPTAIRALSGRAPGALADLLWIGAGASSGALASGLLAARWILAT